MRLLIIQFGNFAEGERRLTSGGKENYYAQRYTINFVAELVRRGCEVCVITIGEDYATEQLPSGVQAAGLSLYRGRFRRPRTRELIGMVENWRPTHLLLQSPIVGVLHWALRQNVEILPLFADSSARPGFDDGYGTEDSPLR